MGQPSNLALKNDERRKVYPWEIRKGKLMLIYKGQCIHDAFAYTEEITIRKAWGEGMLGTVYRGRLRGQRVLVYPFQLDPQAPSRVESVSALADQIDSVIHMR